jgi:DNA topoisomerase-1
VESPAKAKTIGKFLGDKYHVVVSVGHIRDLLKSQLSVDVENNFTPKYRVPNEKKEVVREIAALASKSSKVFLATDPDREGEAIAWHLMDTVQIPPERTERVVFHEITRRGRCRRLRALLTRALDMEFGVNAHQARRVLDRLVGYGVSPILLAQKVRGGLSATAACSPSRCDWYVEREREIQGFIPNGILADSRRFSPPENQYQKLPCQAG